MKESINRKEKQEHSRSHVLAAGALALALLTGCEEHFPNDKFLMGVEDRSGTINFRYTPAKLDTELNYDIIVKENGDSGYVAYITSGPDYSKKKNYTIEAKDMNGLKSNLEYDLIIARSDDIFSQSECNTKDKIADFTEKYDKFLRESEQMFIEIREQELRLNDIKLEIQELKKNKTKHNNEMVKGLQQEKRYIEKRLKQLRKPIEVPYDANTHFTGN